MISLTISLLLFNDTQVSRIERKLRRKEMFRDSCESREYIYIYTCVCIRIYIRATTYEVNFVNAFFYI